MYVQVDKSKETKRKPVANSVGPKPQNMYQGSGLADNRAGIVAQRRLFLSDNTSQSEASRNPFPLMKDNRTKSGIARDQNILKKHPRNQGSISKAAPCKQRMSDEEQGPTNRAANPTQLGAVHRLIRKWEGVANGPVGTEVQIYVAHMVGAAFNHANAKESGATNQNVFITGSVAAIATQIMTQWPGYFKKDNPWYDFITGGVMADSMIYTGNIALAWTGTEDAAKHPDEYVHGIMRMGWTLIGVGLIFKAMARILGSRYV